MMLAILDGQIRDAAEARIPVADDGFLRGDGVFEVIRLYGGRPYALDDHLVRIANSAANLRLPIDVDAVRADVETLLEANVVEEAALRVVVTRGGHRLAMVEELKPLPDTLAVASIEYAPTRVLDGVKSLSYAGNMLARRLAQERGADDALLVTPHGRVLEGPTCSFVCSFDGATLVTPPL
jgi:branched-chain amino acid aminotransferase